MTKIILTSSNFEGQIILVYGLNNYLISFTNEAELSDKHHEFFVHNFPYSYDVLKSILSRSKSLDHEIIHQVPTFEEFWEKYNFKVDKALALKEWEKMNDIEMIKSVLNIKDYDKYLDVSGEKKIYPVRYLSRKRYEVDYKSLTKNVNKR